jgi:CTP:molybdopterin cytidylyltransferase MocA
MGQTKQLLPLGNRTVIEHCIGTIIDAGIKEVVVVLGPESREISELIHNLAVTIAKNEEESEMADSVRIGLKKVNAVSTGVLICLADHPLVRTDTMKALIAAHQEYPESIIIPSLKGKRGHPTLFPRDIIQEVFVLSTMRDVIRDHEEEISYLNVDDDGVLLDMDTTGDYELVLEKFNKGG